jgi:hypothetical protein
MSRLFLLRNIEDGNGPGQVDSPWLMGPDCTKQGVVKTFASEFLDAVQARRVPIDVFTWHHYYATAASVFAVDDFIDPVFLNRYLTVAARSSLLMQTYRKQAQAPRSQLWMGETGGAGSAAAGSEHVIGKALGMFWYADKLGAAAQTGHAVVCKQQYHYQVISVDGGGVRVTPEFWLTQLWKQLMGTHVLRVLDSVAADIGKLPGSVRVYAHGGAAGTNHGDGVCTAMIINLGAESRKVSLSLAHVDAGTTQLPINEYALTAYPTRSDLQSTQLALNGQQLLLGEGGALPTLGGAPRLADIGSNMGVDVVVDGLSVIFVEFPTCGCDRQ